MSNWKSIKLIDLCDVEYGTRVVRKRDAGTIFPVYGGGGATFSMDVYNRENRMVIARFGMSEKCTRFVKGKFFLNDSGLTISAKDKKLIDEQFLNYQMLSLNDTIYSLARGTAQKNLNVDEFKNLTLSFPNSIEKQKEIAEFLDQAFQSIEKAKANIERNIENAKELFQSKLNKVFSQTGEGYKSKTLGEVCELIKRGVAPKYIEDGGMQVINQKCIRDHKVNFNLSRRHDFKSKVVNEERLIKKGDVLVNSTGTGTLGRVAQIRKDINEKITVDTHVTIVRPIENLFFIDFFGFAMIYLEKSITDSGEGTSGQTELSRKKLENDFKISYPDSIKIQKEIVETLDIVDNHVQSLILSYEEELKNLEELKKSILQKAFSGELTNKNKAA